LPRRAGVTRTRYLLFGPGGQFETYSDVLRSGALIVIEEAAQSLRNNPTLVVEVAGHTDDRGDSEYNRGLSEYRAETVRDFLVSLVVNADNLRWRGYGEMEPIADNTTPEGRQQNRRVVLNIIRR
jgi:outer membrane protein OmpA-like peptidoglycan-associated protein